MIEADSAEQIAEQIHAFGWDNDYDQIRAGAFRGRVGVAQIGPIQVATLAYTNQILSRGASPAGCVTLAFVGHVEGRARWRGHEVTPDLTLVSDERIEIDLLMGETFVLWLLVVPEALIGDAATALRSRDRLALPARIRRQLVAHIQVGLRHTTEPAATPLGPAAVARFQDRSVALARLALRGESGWSTPPPLARRLERLVRMDALGVLTVPRMADRLHVGERTLRRASRDAFACSPLQFAKTLRLNAVWRDLNVAQPAGARVWEVAARHGFWHMGQLGRDFRRLFGHSPGSVLRTTIAGVENLDR